MKNLKERVLNKVASVSAKAYIGATTAIVTAVNECPIIANAPRGGVSEQEVSNQVTGPMLTLIRVILTVMSVVGVFMLVKSIMELVNAIQTQDNSGIFHAGRGIGVALLMIAITPVVSLFVDLG